MTYKIPKHRQRTCPKCGGIAELVGATIICGCGYKKNLFDDVL